MAEMGDLPGNYQNVFNAGEPPSRLPNRYPQECDHLSLLTRDSFPCQFAENLLPPPDKSYARVGMGALLDRQCAAMKR